MTPFLKNLHWLPVEGRVEFKIICIIFKLIYHCETAPHYLKDLISIHQSKVNTRGSEGVKLGYPRVRPATTRAYGDRAFSIHAPKVWNALPGNLRNINIYEHFKSTLKTFLFKKHLS